jgi:hypothetical protein
MILKWLIFRVVLFTGANSRNKLVAYFTSYCVFGLVRGCSRLFVVVLGVFGLCSWLFGLVLGMFVACI